MAEPTTPTCQVHVHVTRTWDDGDVTTDEHHTTWPCTASEAVAARLKRFKEAHIDATRDGLTITARVRRDEHDEVEVLTFTDEETDRG